MANKKTPNQNEHIAALAKKIDAIFAPKMSKSKKTGKPEPVSKIQAERYEEIKAAIDGAVIKDVLVASLDTEKFATRPIDKKHSARLQAAIENEADIPPLVVKEERIEEGLVYYLLGGYHRQHALLAKDVADFNVIAIQCSDEIATLIASADNSANSLAVDDKSSKKNLIDFLKRSGVLEVYMSHGAYQVLPRTGYSTVSIAKLFALSQPTVSRTLKKLKKEVEKKSNGDGSESSEAGKDSENSKEDANEALVNVLSEDNDEKRNYLSKRCEKALAIILEMDNLSDEFLEGLEKLLISKRNEALSTFGATGQSDVTQEPEEYATYRVSINKELEKISGGLKGFNCSSLSVKRSKIKEYMAEGKSPVSAAHDIMRQDSATNAILSSYLIRNVHHGLGTGSLSS